MKNSSPLRRLYLVDAEAEDETRGPLVIIGYCDVRLYRTRRRGNDQGLGGGRTQVALMRARLVDIAPFWGWLDICQFQVLQIEPGFFSQCVHAKECDKADC